MSASQQSGSLRLPHGTLAAGFVLGFALLVYGAYAAPAGFARLGHLQAFAGTQRKGLLLLAVLVPLFLVAMGLSIAGPSWRRRSSHGTAAWGNPAPYLAPQHGFILGAKRGRLLRHSGEAHLLTVAPSGAGKGVGVVIPNLLDYRGSCVVVDIKGENYSVSARYRESVLGQRIHVLDPFGVVLTNNPAAARHTASYNTLDFVDPSAPDAFDAANLIASSLIVPDPGAQLDSIWIEAARDITTALLLYIASARPPAERHLGTLATLLSLPDAKLRELLEQLGTNPSYGSLIANAANRLRDKDERLFGSVYFTAATKGVRGILEAPSLQRVSRVSTFHFRDLRKMPSTVYLILPPNYVDTWGKWLRLMVSAALHELTPAAPPVAPERLLFLLDELPTLGHLPTLAEKIAYGRGYGLTLWLIVQDLAQLRDRYPKQWETLLSQTRIKQFFGTNDNFTAEYVSKLTGQSTVVSYGTGASRGTTASAALFGGNTTSNSNSEGSVGRPLLFPDEVRRLPEQELLLFQAGEAPVRADRLNYLAHPAFRRRHDRNPLHAE